MVDSTTVPLFTPAKIGDLELQNRIVMSALTRQRANIEDGIPTDDFVTYYSLRGDAGLIFTESIPVSIEGNAYLGAGCLYTDEQEAGWKKVVDAVHSKGAKIFAQLFHGGRACVSSEIGGLQPVAPSPIHFSTKYNHPNPPREATIDDIERIKKDYLASVERAKRAGFDGVEIHGANGYLPDQFLRESSNQRTDKYGGSIENRCRFLLELLDDACKVFSPSRVGTKLGLYNTYLDMDDGNPDAILQYLIGEFNKRNLGYLECKEGIRDGAIPIHQQHNTQKEKFKKTFNGIWIANNGYTYEAANADIAKGEVDLVSFGVLFVMNDNLVEKFRKGLELNTFMTVSDRRNLKFYFQGNKAGRLGYLDLSPYQSEKL